MDEDFKELKKNILKTGTSIVGIVCRDGIVMAGDRQVTGGQMIVMNKKYPKIIKINDYLIAGIAGLLSDAQLVAKLTKAELRLKELRSKQRPSVKEGAFLFTNIIYNNIRKFSPIPGIVAGVVAGFDEDGSTILFSIDPAGAIYQVEDYVADGSGMPYILGVLERNHNQNITVKEGVQLAIECIKASTQRDTASGFGIDVFTITKEGIKKEIEQEIVSEYRERKEKKE